jgi:hypothetical protein
MNIAGKSHKPAGLRGDIMRTHRIHGSQLSYGRQRSYGRHRVAVTATALLLTLAGCAGGSAQAGDYPGGAGGDDSSVNRQGTSTPDSPGRAGVKVPPATTGAPPAMPDRTTPTLPAPSPTTPVPGSRDRIAAWKLAGSTEDDRLLLLDVTVGGPPCDVVTAVDKAETSDMVTIKVYAGKPATATCGSGTPAMLGTVRIAVRLAAPLGGRKLT